MSESENRLKIRNQTFSNEIDLDIYVEWDALSGIDFIDCNFKEIDLLGKIINFCNFKNSKFNDLNFRKCQFGKSTFENCEFVNIDLTLNGYSIIVFYHSIYFTLRIKYDKVYLKTILITKEERCLKKFQKIADTLMQG